MKHVLFRPLVNLAVSLVAAFLVAAVAAQDRPHLLLAEKYHQDIDLAAYWVSEKLDGVRAFWDGHNLVSRGGNAFAAPPWFTAGFPAVALDGELWVGRGKFEETVSVVSRHAPHDGWRQVRYMVFDLPGHAGMFDERLQNLRAAVAASPNKFLAVIPQYKMPDHKALLEQLDTVVANGGERAHAASWRFPLPWRAQHGPVETETIRRRGGNRGCSQSRQGKARWLDGKCYGADGTRHHREGWQWVF